MTPRWIVAAALTVATAPAVPGGASPAGPGGAATTVTRGVATTVPRGVVTVARVALAGSVPGGPAMADNWPSFRGPQASGIAANSRPPVTWDIATGENVRWRAEIPGVGHSSPIVWGDRVFVTTAVSSARDAQFLHGRTQTSASAADMSSQSWRAYCLDLGSGEVLWHSTLHEGAPRTPRHVKASYANPTPATNGEQLVVSFGSEGLFGLDLDGTVLWSQDLGVLDGGYTPTPEAHWGFASSPVIYGGLVIVQADAQNQSFLAAYRLQDGHEVWRVPRQEDTSWSTPTVVGTGSDAELVVSGSSHYVGYAPASGEELWRLRDVAGVRIPAPIAAQGLILFGGGDLSAGPAFYAVRRGARGTLPGEDDAPSGAVVWRNEARPHVVTPIAYQGLLYVCTDNGILTIYDLANGERLNRVRIGGRSATFSASPVAAAGNVYFTSEDGEVFVMQAGREATQRAENDVGEVVFATPAVVGDTLIIRGREHLFAVASSEGS